MDKSRYSIEDLKEIIVPIAEKYHISKVYLFGSFARGDQHDQSDLDLRIEKGELKGMFALCGFYTEVEEALHMKVDLLTTHFTEEFKDTYNEMPWNLIKALRNIVAHNYGKIDKEILWETITNDIPTLQNYCLKIGKNLYNNLLY